PRGDAMKKLVAAAAVVATVAVGGWAAATQVRAAQAAATAPMTTEQLIDEFRRVEVSSVTDATEQLYGSRSYMASSMRPVAPTKFAGLAVTVLMRKGEHKEGPAASQGMLDVIDASAPGSVYVMVVEDGLDIAGMGGLM